jgi:hypothetical protein
MNSNKLTPTQSLLIQYQDSIALMLQEDKQYPNLKLSLDAYAKVLSARPVISDCYYPKSHLL